MKHSDIEKLIREGSKIQAIKLWREQTGASLKESKMQIEHFEQTGAWSPVSAPVDSEASSTLTANDTDHSDDDEDATDNIDPVARQRVGIGYWLIVLIMLGFLAKQFLS